MRLIPLICVLNLLSTLSALSPLQELAALNIQIHEREVIDLILTQRRHNHYNYSIDDTNLTLLAPVNATHRNATDQKSRQFQQGLQLLSSHKSGLRSFMFFLSNKLYVAQAFDNQTHIFQAEGKLVYSIQSRVLQISIVKATIDYELCYLDSEFGANCAVYAGNVTALAFERTQLQVKQADAHLFHHQIYYHVQKYQSMHLHSLLLKDGHIRVFGASGIQRNALLSQTTEVVAYLNHNPYPMIVGKDRISFLETYRATQSSLGCPILTEEILSAELQTPFSNTFYLQTPTHLVVMTYSLKKSERHCKVVNKIPLTSPSPSPLRMMYPTLLLNDTFMNLTDTLNPSQVKLPFPVCASNHYESQYRNNEQYLLHRCCQVDSCTSHIYLRSKKQVHSSKYYKYIMLLGILAIFALKVWNKKEKLSTTDNDIPQNGRGEDPLVKLASRLSKNRKVAS